MATDKEIRWTRRSVLRSAATATAAAALPSWFLEASSSRAFAEEKSPNERPKVALVGCGGQGTADAKSAQRFGDIVAVCDVEPAMLTRLERRLRGRPSITTIAKSATCRTWMSSSTARRITGIRLLTCGQSAAAKTSIAKSR